MICTIFLLWFSVFAAFFSFHILSRSKIFGIISGIILLLFGAFVISEGIQINVANYVINNISDAPELNHSVLKQISIEYSNSWVFGLIFIATSFYIIFKNAFSIKDIL